MAVLKAVGVMTTLRSIVSILMRQRYRNRIRDQEYFLQCYNYNVIFKQLEQARIKPTI